MDVNEPVAAKGALNKNLPANTVSSLAETKVIIKMLVFIQIIFDEFLN